MKTLTEMKKVYYIRRFSLLIIALTLAIGFTSCGSDNEIPKISINDVNGNYTGKMETLATQPQNRSTGTPVPGITVTAEVKENNLFLKKFPIEDIVKSILGDTEEAAGIIQAIGDVNYQIAFQSCFNDNQDMIILKLDPKPLEINRTIPPTTEGGEATELKVKVTITADKEGTFAYDNKKLNFTIHATEVFLNNSETSLPNFNPTSFKFDLNKK